MRIKITKLLFKDIRRTKCINFKEGNFIFFFYYFIRTCTMRHKKIGVSVHNNFACTPNNGVSHERNIKLGFQL